MNADVPREFVAAREAAVAVVHWAGVWPLVGGSLAGSVGVLAGFHRQQFQGVLLVWLAQHSVGGPFGAGVFWFIVHGLGVAKILHAL